MPQPTLAPAPSDEREKADFASTWRTWHQHRLQGPLAPHWFPADTARHWVAEEPTRFAEVPGC